MNDKFGKPSFREIFVELSLPVSYPLIPASWPCRLRNLQTCDRNIFFEKGIGACRFVKKDLMSGFLSLHISYHRYYGVFEPETAIEFLFSKNKYPPVYVRSIVKNYFPSPSASTPKMKSVRHLRRPKIRYGNSDPSLYLPGETRNLSFSFGITFAKNLCCFPVRIPHTRWGFGMTKESRGLEV